MRARAGRARDLRGWLFIGPALLFVAVFVLVSLGQLVHTSLTDRSLLGGGRFVGLENYLRIWRDESFWRALRFTA
jgi:multiple sugar transport system permease protein